MRYHDILTEKKKSIIPVEWPTDLAWKIQFTKYKDVPPIIDMRANKLFAMPFRNWSNTFTVLTGKDTTKVKFMDTRVLRVPHSAIVADMKLFDKALDQGAEYSEAGRKMLEEYERTSVSYADFVNKPTMFINPEILIPVSDIEFLPFKVTIEQYVKGGEGYRLGILEK